MMLKHKGKSQSIADSLPNDTEMRKRGIYDSEFARCRNAVGLTSSTYTAFLSAAAIEEKLKMYGPIWVSGRYCESSYKHIVVVVGVKSPLAFFRDEVLINDPYSGFTTSLNKARWIPLERFVERINKVAFACQHWM
jgi:hypothetical protein